MKRSFGTLPSGEQATLYTISCGDLAAGVTDYGATLVNLLVPDAQGVIADVVLGCDDANAYTVGTAFLGATVGRNANRIQGAAFSIGGNTVHLTPNEGINNLHSGPDCYHTRLWEVIDFSDSAITFQLRSSHGDQGFPGTAIIRVTYSLESNRTLRITYDAICDRDTVFNMTNHSYFNLAGHNKPDAALDQTLMMPARFFTPDDAESIPTGELCPVDGTPMDFRTPKPIRQDLDADFEPLHLQSGYDHNFEVFCNPCAILRDPVSGRTMSISTDCPGIQFYSGNYLDKDGKDGIHYGKHGGIALETQFFPDAVHHPEWAQPFTPAGKRYHSETCYHFN